MNQLIYWFIEMEFKDEEELRTNVKVYIILHMIVFYRRMIESIIKLTVIRTEVIFFPLQIRLASLESVSGILLYQDPSDSAMSLHELESVAYELSKSTNKQQFTDVPF